MCRTKAVKRPADGLLDGALPGGDDEEDEGDLGSDEYEPDSFINDESDIEDDAMTSGENP